LSLSDDSGKIMMNIIEGSQYSVGLQIGHLPKSLLLCLLIRNILKTQNMMKIRRSIYKSFFSFLFFTAWMT